MHLKTRKTLNLHLRGLEFQIQDKNYCKHTLGQNKTSPSLLKYSKPNSKIDLRYRILHLKPNQRALWLVRSVERWVYKVVFTRGIHSVHLCVLINLDITDLNGMCSGLGWLQWHTDYGLYTGYIKALVTVLYTRFSHIAAKVHVPDRTCQTSHVSCATHRPGLTLYIRVTHAAPEENIQDAGTPSNRASPNKEHKMLLQCNHMNNKCTNWQRCNKMKTQFYSHKQFEILYKPWHLWCVFSKVFDTNALLHKWHW